MDAQRQVLGTFWDRWLSELPGGEYRQTQKSLLWHRATAQPSCLLLRQITCVKCPVSSFTSGLEKS